MVRFIYEAKSSPGQIETGVIEAENDIVAAGTLRQRGLFPVSIKRTEEVSANSKDDTQKLKAKEVVEFTRQLANLVRAGFTLPRALYTLCQQIQRPSVKTVIKSLYEKISKGESFSQCLRAYPNIFSPFYVSMIHVGEKGGRLDESLEKLADAKEKEEELFSQIKSALTYPVFLSIVGAGTIFV